MSKYQPLFRFLSESSDAHVELSFDEIEAILHSHLPDSARSSEAWWSNRRRGGLQAAAWLAAGYEVTDVDLHVGRVKLRRKSHEGNAAQLAETLVWDASNIGALRVLMSLSQSELAEQLGVRQQTISEWENGKYQPSRAMSRALTLLARHMMKESTQRKEDK